MEAQHTLISSIQCIISLNFSMPGMHNCHHAISARLLQLDFLLFYVHLLINTT